MSEHNKNFYSLKEVERCLEASKEFQDGEEIYYFIGALRYVYDENKQLKEQLQQKEKNINKAIKILNKYRNRKDAYCLWCMEYGDNAEVIKILGGEVKNE